MQTNVLLSIKPQFADLIFEGKKLFEFRRKIFSRQDVSKIIVYASLPRQLVIGEFEIETIIEASIPRLWARTKHKSGISKDYFDTYFAGLEKGYAIKVGKTTIYTHPVSLQETFNIKHPPQSFIYIYC